MWHHSSTAVPRNLRSLLRPAAPAALLLSAVAALAAPGTPKTQAPGLPLTFEKNTGQYPKEVQFVGRTSGGTVFLTRREAVIALTKGGKAAALRLKLTGSNAKAAVSGLEKQAGIVNYFIGNDPKKWHARVPTYSRVKLAGVYPGVDLVYYGAGQGRTLEYDFVVKPGSDPGKIRMAVSGAKSLRTAGGRLIASTACGDVTLNKPYAYQMVDGKRTQVACAFTLERNQVAFQIARYDASRPLVVDPSVAYATFLGGDATDKITCAAVAGDGTVTTAGVAVSANLSTTAGVLMPAKPGGDDAFVAKLNADATALVYCTYLGGSGTDTAMGLALDTTGRPYLCGSTYSADFPTTPGAFQTTRASTTSYDDSFIVALAGDGSSLRYSTFYGAFDYDSAAAITVDASDNATVVGYMRIGGLASAGAYQTINKGIDDGYVVRLNSAGQRLWGTMLGGNGSDYARSVAVNAAGEAVVAGLTGSSNFPTTADACDSSANGGNDVFVAVLSNQGNALAYSTFLGGSGDENKPACALGPDDAIYVSGKTGSADFPVTPGAHMTTRPNAVAGFLAKLVKGSATLTYCTYMGGATVGQSYHDNNPLSVAVTASGSACVVGCTGAVDYPTTPDALQATVPANGGQPTGFVTVLNPSGSAMTYSSYIGGTSRSWEQLRHVTVAPDGSLILSGDLGSGAPTTPGVVQPTNAGLGDGYLMKLNLGGEPSALAVDNLSATAGARATLRAKLTKSGSAYAGQRLEFQIDSGAWTPAEVLTSTAGYGTLTITAPATGSHTVACRFAGGGAIEGSTGNATLTTTAIAATTLVVPGASPGVGDDVYLAAYLSATSSATTLGAPLIGKQVEFQFNGGAWTPASALTDAVGRAVLAVTTPATAGNYTINARFAGDAGAAACTGTGTLTATAKRNIYLYTLSRTGKVGVPGQLFAYFYWYQKDGTLTPISGKSVRFVCAGTGTDTSATTGANGRAAITVTPATAGTYPFTVTFTADTDYNAGNGSGTLTVAP